MTTGDDVSHLPAPAVDVVILTWNDGDVLGAAVGSALASTGVDVHVTVVDNASDSPPTLPIDNRITRIRNGSNAGVAAARNQGVRAGSRPLVCLLDSDARLEPGSLAQLCAPLLIDGSVGLTAPVFMGQNPRASAGRMPGFTRKLMRVAGLTALYAPTRGNGDVDFAIGACQVFPRAVFDAVGGIDESYFYGPEDLDFCARIRRVGYRVKQVATDGCHHPPRRRHRRLLTAGGARHGLAVARYLVRAKLS